MSDDRKELYGYKIDPNGHHEVFKYMEKHMSKQEMEQLHHAAQNYGHGVFNVHINGGDYRYKMMSDGKLHKDQ